MKYRIDIEIADKKINFVKEFFKTLTFVKTVKVIPSKEITNPAILASIDAYEKGIVQHSPMNLSELKEYFPTQTRLSAKYGGIISKEDGNKLNRHIEDMRN